MQTVQEKEIINEMKALCEDLILWRASPENQNYKLIFNIHHNAQALEDDKKSYKNFNKINFNDILEKYNEFSIENLSNFKWVNQYCLKYLYWVNQYCLKYLYYYSDANLKFDITNGGI